MARVDPDLFADLKKLLGPECLSLEAADLDRHSYDCWPVAVKWQRQERSVMRPDLVVRPRHQDEVARVLAWANARGIAVTPWGAGSSVTGAPLAAQGGICLDLGAMDRTLQIDPLNHLVRVEAGKLGHHLEGELNDAGFTLNHSPQSLDRSTVGGWLSTRSSGQFSSRWGNIEDLCLFFVVVLADGRVVETPRTPRAATGPDMRHFFIGAEGTAGVITEVCLKIFPLPEKRLFETIRFAALHQGLEAMRCFMQAGLRPFLVRLYDAEESGHALRDEEFAAPVLFAGCEGLERMATPEMAAVVDICVQCGGECLGSAPVEAWMQRRFDFSAIEQVLAKPGGLAETIEVAHFWSALESTYETMKTALEPLADRVLGHFSHVYPQGASLYLILMGTAADDAAATREILRIWDVAMAAALRCGAAISHHHGIGYVRRSFVEPYLGAGFEILRRFKAAVDPQGIMNPGKLV